MPSPLLSCDRCLTQFVPRVIYNRLERHAPPGCSPGDRRTPDPLGATLLKLAGTLGVADRVHLIGWIADEEKNAWIQHAAVGLVPSSYESVGIVAIELMAAGIPVVVSDVGGLAEMVTDGVDGRRVPPADPGPLAATVDKLLDAPQTAAAMGEAGRTSVLRRFIWDDIARQSVAVYRG